MLRKLALTHRVDDVVVSGLPADVRYFVELYFDGFFPDWRTSEDDIGRRQVEDGISVDQDSRTASAVLAKKLHENAAAIDNAVAAFCGNRSIELLQTD